MKKEIVNGWNVRETGIMNFKYCIERKNFDDVIIKYFYNKKDAVEAAKSGTDNKVGGTGII